MKNTRRLPPIAYLLLTVALFWSCYQLFQNITQPDRTNLTNRRSLGEKFLVKEIDSSEKREGIKSFADRDIDRYVAIAV